MSVKVDPRIKRTRHLLQRALDDLLREKEFHAISVQDITERAEVNRATFYAHFEDKYALLNYNIRESFLQALHRRAADWATFSPETLRALVMVAYEFLAQFSGRCPSHGAPPPTQNDDHLFALSEVQKQVSSILIGWMKTAGTTPAAACETAATVMGWSVFGSSFQWSRTERNLTSAEAADRILALILPGLMPYLAQTAAL